MSDNIRLLFKNFFFVISSNLVSVLISIVVLLVLPKFLGVENYGYFQLYIFYSTFIGFLHFGFNDGLYLRIGGRNYEDLEGKLYFSQFYILLFFQVTLAAISFVWLHFGGFSEDKKFVIQVTAFCMVIVNARYMLLFLLQATYKIKEYSIITLFDRIAYLVFVLGLVFNDSESYQVYILADVVAKLLTLILACFFCREFIFLRYGSFVLKKAINEVFLNIRVGIKLMLSNIAGKLIVGNVRFGIEAVWTVAVFGKISLMLSMTSFLMIFINSISLVLFPFLRRVDITNLPPLYLKLRRGVSFLLLSFLMLYVPAYKVLSYWLPEYRDAFIYLYLIFPIIIFEGKMGLLINTYLKVLRKEDLLLQVNFISVILSFIVTYFTVYQLESLGLAILGILILTMFKVVVFEMFIQKLLRIVLLKSIVIECLAVLLFILLNKYYDINHAGLGYFLLLLVYFYFNRHSLKEILILLRGNLQRSK